MLMRLRPKSDRCGRVWAGLAGLRGGVGQVRGDVFELAAAKAEAVSPFNASACQACLLRRDATIMKICMASGVLGTPTGTKVCHVATDDNSKLGFLRGGPWRAPQGHLLPKRKCRHDPRRDPLMPFLVGGGLTFRKLCNLAHETVANCARLHDHRSDDILIPPPQVDRMLDGVLDLLQSPRSVPIGPTLAGLAPNRHNAGNTWRNWVQIQSTSPEACLHESGRNRAEMTFSFYSGL